MIAWYRKPGWWIFIVVALVIWMGIITAPSQSWTEPQTITVYGPMTCFKNPDNPDRLDCKNPSTQPQPRR